MRNECIKYIKQTRLFNDKYFYFAVGLINLVHITPGPYYKRALKAANELNFKGITLHKENNKANPQINYGQFYRSLQKSIEKRLMSDGDEELTNDTKVYFVQTGHRMSVQI